MTIDYTGSVTAARTASGHRHEIAAVHDTQTRRLRADARASPRLSDGRQVQGAREIASTLDRQDGGAVDALPDLPRVDLDKGRHRVPRAPRAPGPSPCRWARRPRRSTGRPG